MGGLRFEAIYGKTHEANRGNAFSPEANLENEFLTYYNQTAKPINWTYTVEKLEQKIGTDL